MVSNKQRQRQLARARWERQQARRAVIARRQRLISIVGGVIVGLIAVALLVWLVLHIIDQEKARNDQTPVIPTDSFSTDLLTPSSGGTDLATTATSEPTRSEPTKHSRPTKPGPTRTKATKTGGN